MKFLRIKNFISGFMTNTFVEAGKNLKEKAVMDASAEDLNE